MEYAELPQHRSAVVIDSFAGQAIIGPKRIHTAEWELDAPPSRRQTTPSAEVRAADHDFNHDGILRHVSTPDFNLQVREGAHELLVKQAHSVPARIVFAPGLIIVACRIAEGGQYTFKVVLVLESNVLLNHCDASRSAVCRSRFVDRHTSADELRNPDEVPAKNTITGMRSRYRHCPLNA